MGLTIKAKNDWPNGQPQVANRHLFYLLTCFLTYLQMC